MPAWFERMNPRERVLSLVVAALLFLLINFFIWSSLLGSLRNTRTELASRESLRAQQQVFLRERDLWDKRADWLKKHQPVMSSPAEASNLLTEVQEVAAK